MATKKFAQMTTKKLNALLATASDEDKKAIEAVLAAREQAQAPAASVSKEEISASEVGNVEDILGAQLTPKEKAAIK